MNIKYLFNLIVLLILTGCSSISGTVVDGDTDKPIEGAVVHVEWTKTKGILGLTYGEFYKIAETVTDKEGKFKISEFLRPPVNPPTVVVYKRGYVAWRNDFIFPEYKKREDSQWKNGHVIRLEHYKKKFSHYKHIFFFSSSMDVDSSSKLYEAYAWEDSLASRELDLFRKKFKILKTGESEDRIWNEIIQELYLHNGSNTGK